MARPPQAPRIYHIVHCDRLPSIIADRRLWCDAETIQRSAPGTTIGMSSIKERRLTLPLSSHTELAVGDCVPFYFCPRSVMLFVIHKGNHPELAYRGGQAPIVHLEADFHETIRWAEKKARKWAFTTSNAGSFYFEDYADPERLDQVDWTAVRARSWQDHREGKQAEFLIERSFPWKLVRSIGVVSKDMRDRVRRMVDEADHPNKPDVDVRPSWYY